MRVSPLFRGLIARLRSWTGALTGRRRLEAEMDAELAAHLELRTADLVRAGLSPEEAARMARIELGTTLTHKEGMRAALGLRWIDEVRDDLRFALRMMRKSPGFTAIATLSLSLAIGANAAIFSLAKSVLYDRLNVPHPRHLLMFQWIGDDKKAVHNIWGDFDEAPNGGTKSHSFPFPVYLEMAKHPAGLVSLAAFKENGMNATVRGVARRVDVSMVTGNYYSTIEVKPQLGRALQPSDDTVQSTGGAVVISDSLWAREFDRSPQALGQVITLNQQQMTIVGVNPKGFTGTKSALSPADLFVPLSMEPMLQMRRSKRNNLEDANSWWVNIVGRIAPGTKIETAEAGTKVQFEAAVKSLVTIGKGETIPVLHLEDGSRGLHWTDGTFKKPVYVLLSLTGFVLLLACANVANLLLSRGAQRQREMSVRMALGAGRIRVARQLLTESLLLAALGGCGGLLLGYLCRNALPMLMKDPWEDFSVRVSFDWGVFACTSVVVLLTGILFGLAPAWFAARTQVSSSLKEFAQTTTRRRRGLSGKSLVGLQIALSTLLVVGAGLFLRTLTSLSTQNFGFNTDHLILFDINPPAARYFDGKDVLLHAELERRIAVLPGVEHVSPAALPYLAQTMTNTDFLPEGEKYDKNKRQAEFFNVVGNDFFATMGIPIIAGRGFGPQDTASSEKVAVINQALAKKRFLNQNPIGKQFSTSTDDDGGKEKQVWYRIVGICADNTYASLRDEPPAQFMIPFVQQKEVDGMTYEVRTRLAPASMAPLLLRTVQSLDRDLPVTSLRTQKEQINATLQVERTLAALTAGFGLLALALACVGIYGVMAFTVAQRTNEIGIRLALGALPRQVRRMILGESTTLAVVGIVVGAGGALALARLVRTMLYGVQFYDPATLAGCVALLLGVALAAAWIPARRAAGVQPMEALRHE